MNQPPEQPFDDPELKAALRRTLSRESAPPALRERILALRTSAANTASAPNASDAPIPLRPRRSPVFKLAIAAVLLIGVGGVAYQVWDMNRPAPPTTYANAGAISNSLYNAMIATHKERLASPAGDIQPKTIAAAAALAPRIARPVFAADLTADGWTFAGVAVRNVGTQPAAHLFFTKGNAALSVLSMPANAAPDARDNESYAATVANHMIAGFKRGPGLYCIVASSPDNSLTLDEVKRLLETHKPEVVFGG